MYVIRDSILKSNMSCTHLKELCRNICCKQMIKKIKNKCSHLQKNDSFAGPSRDRGASFSGSVRYCEEGTGMPAVMLNNGDFSVCLISSYWTYKPMRAGWFQLITDYYLYYCL